MQRQLNRQRKAARNRKLGAFAVVGLIAAAAIVTALVWSGERAAPGPSIATEPGRTGQTLSIVDVGSGEGAPLPLPVGASDFDVALDGSMVTYTDSDENGNAQVFAMDVDGSNARQLTHEDGGVAPRGLSWSPDGSTVAYEGDTSDGSQIFVVSVADGVSTQVTTEPRGAVDPGGWTPDGKSILFSTIDAADPYYMARSVDLSTGRSRLVVADASTPALSPDGTSIAFNSWSKQPVRLIVANIDGSHRRVIARLDNDDGYEKWSPDSTKVAYVGSTDEHGYGTYVYDLDTGETRFVTDRTVESWMDNDHMLVS